MVFKPEDPKETRKVIHFAAIVLDPERIDGSL